MFNRLVKIYGGNIGVMEHVSRPSAGNWSKRTATRYDTAIIRYASRIPTFSLIYMYIYIATLTFREI